MNFFFSERETGLEPAASTLARSRSTNWATRAFVVLSNTSDIIHYDETNVNIFFKIFSKKFAGVF